MRKGSFTPHSTEALELSERRRKDAQRLSGVGFWELDHKQNSLYWSEEIYNIYEISTDIEPSYERFLALTHEDDRELVNQNYRNSVATKEEYDLRYRVNAGGCTKWIEARGVTYYDDAGSPERSIGTAQDISEIIAAQQKIEHLAYHDGLTGLPNRRLFSDRIDAAMKLAARKGSKLAVLFIDIDNFKKVNDGYGHEIGDELLVAFAARLRASARASDTFARVGGDEFAGVMIDVDTMRVDNAVLNVKRSIEGLYDTQVGSFDVTASIGVTIYPSDSDESDILLRHADQAMYEAKDGGRSKVCYFDFQKHRSVQERRQMLLDLDVAITKGELELFFQPRVRLDNGMPVGAEALLRWFTSAGPVDPADVVKAIRGTYLEWKLDTWVIETQLGHVKGFRERGLQGPFSLNVCPSTIENERFPRHLEALLENSGVAGSDIEIEVLEVSAIKNFERTGINLGACKKFGVGFSLDDFGTGYSSLTYFHSLPIDKLKIDQRFIRTLDADEGSLPLVKSILALAQANERTVVAEGVESVVIAQILAELGCQYAQGFGISRPVSVTSYEAWIDAWDSAAFVSSMRSSRS